MNRNLIAVLAISLALNLFILGAAASLWVVRGRIAALQAQPAPAAKAAANAGGNPLAQALRRLGPDDREALRLSLKTRQPKIAPLRLEGRKARAEAAELLSAPQADHAAISAAMARARAADIAARTETEEAVIDVVAGLDQADRSAVADAIRPKAAQPQAQPGAQAQ